jgi:hypothetical protein
MPEPLNSSVALHPNCRCLRSKEMFYEVEGGADPIHASGSGIFWCTHTQNCLGPDGQVAEPKRCKPGRECYDAV